MRRTNRKRKQAPQSRTSSLAVIARLEQRPILS